MFEIMDSGVVKHFAALIIEADDVRFVGLSVLLPPTPNNEDKSAFDLKMESEFARLNFEITTPHGLL